jgi:NAD-dependent dihydropyrimidine dehydrogenase PreA subunit
MAKRNIVKIDQDKCNGCGKCVKACVEGAIELINGKAELVSEIYCDGLGACIGSCPQDAIIIEQREAGQFDEQATKEHLANIKDTLKPIDFVCPGMMAKQLRDKAEKKKSAQSAGAASQLSHWPVQLKLVPAAAPYFAGADLLLAADCVPFAMGDFHQRFLTGRSVVIGCPKLDDAKFYVEKLAEILKANRINSLSVVHMEVPCCSGLTAIAKKAIAQNNSTMPFEDITISLRGEIIRTETVQVS